MNNKFLNHFKLPTIRNREISKNLKMHSHFYVINLVLLILLFIPFTFAVQPTQQYNKIYLTPFYRVSMNANTQYNYTLSVTAPDGISQMKSAIITFNIQINGQTQNYTLRVNNQSCNNADYYIATAFSTTGTSQIYFDCTNIITHTGNYNIALTSAVNTGTIQGWIDLTYMNNPIGDVLLHGTEYVPTDDAKLFLQFLDSNKLAITNSACTLNLWYPNGTKLANNSAMTYLDDGIYYYNFVVPNVLGVYPASAKCYYPFTFGNITLQNNVTESWDSNNFTGGIGWAYSNAPNSTNGWDYYSVTVVTNATAGTGGCQDGLYCARIEGISQSAQYLERGFITPPNTQKLTISFWLKSTLGTSDTASYDIFDGNFHQLDVYAGSQFSAGVWYRKEYNISVSSGYYLDSTAILQGFYAISWTASNKYLYMDNFTVTFVVANTTISNVSAYQVLMGSGEVHVSKLYQTLNATLSASTPAQIWNYTNRTLTSSENYTEEARVIWNYTSRNLTYYQNFTTPQQDLTNYTRIQNNQYNYTSRFDYIDNVMYMDFLNLSSQINNMLINLTSEIQNVITYILSVPFNVWNYATRNLTYYPAMNVTTQVVNVNNVTINVTTQNVTVQNVSVYVTNYTINLTTQNVSVQNVSVYVTNYTINLTTQNVSVQNVSVYVTNYTINLTTQNVSVNNVSVYVTNYTINLTTQNVSVENVSVYVTNYTINITTQQINVTTQVVNVTTQIVNVDNVTINVTTQQVVVSNITLNASDIWNYPNRNLTYYQNFTEPQVDMTNYTRIDDTIYAVNQSLYQKIIDESDLILNTTINLWYNTTAEIGFVPFNVWYYMNRTLTFYPTANFTQSDLTNYTRIEEGVWNYTGRYTHGVILT